jgi:hypothetical protein
MPKEGTGLSAGLANPKGAFEAKVSAHGRALESMTSWSTDAPSAFARFVENAAELVTEAASISRRLVSGTGPLLRGVRVGREELLGWCRDAESSAVN